MGALDSLIAIALVSTFFFFVASKVYGHEKEHLDPIIEKIKGWFKKDEEEGEADPNEDFDISFRGQMKEE